MTRRLTRLTLTDFRSYPALTWSPGARLQVLHGPNGSGKTNLLEALSLLTPGRGLRAARAAELRRNGSPRWAVAAVFETAAGALRIGTGTEPDSDRRLFRLDDQPVRAQAEIAAHLAAVWLTPPMERLFQEGGSGRRRFLDRLVLALEPAHAREMAAHETLVAQRNRLLTEPRPDPAWLDGIEAAIARHAVAATVARARLTRHLTAALAAGASAPFPPARLDLVCPIADRLGTALAAEEWLQEALAAARRADRERGGTSHGAHRADIAFTDAAGIAAAQASTGQQKAILLSIVLGHAALIARAKGEPPLLLLDEPLVHLDADRRAALFETLLRQDGMVVLTGTDAEAFAPLAGVAEAWAAGGGMLIPA